jgi:hypothetical protein
MRSRAPRFLLPSFASLLCLTLAFACGTQEVSIPDNFPPPDGSTGKDASDGSVADQSAADTGPDAPDVICPEVLPDDGTGVFVSPGGTNDVSCGTRAAPCKTVNIGITHAVAASKANVYVARGTYVEKVTLAGGVAIVGGWDFPAASIKWRRSCVDPGEIVVLRAPQGQNVTVEARDLSAEPATLSLLRIESKAAAAVAASESLYGLLAIGATTSVVLENVHIEVGAAGAGTSPAKAAAGTGGAVSCAAGIGGPGTAGTPGTGAGIGSFDATGYVPAAATAGNLGTPGNNGLPGTAGACIQCGTCDTFINGCALLPDPAQTCGKDGQPGCGGGPGAVGLPATGGGSSIGIYAWDANVVVRGGKVKSGDAGAGGAGGAGGNGGVPTGAAVGTASDACTSKCDLGALVCVETKTKAAGGAAGTAGGAGGNGGTGGGGGGGSSFALYAGGIGVISTESSPTLGHGKAGAGGGAGATAGASGAAADHVP